MKLEGKLELTWVGKNEEIKLEPRILVEDKSNHTEILIQKICLSMVIIF